MWGTSPISSAAISAAGTLDSDGDGSTNITEINANTNPSDPNSKPAPPPPPPADALPIAKITVAKTTFTVGETATFSGSGSTDDKGITKYEWDLNGDNAIDVSGATASTTYAAAGSYKVTLKVTDTINQTGSASVTITVNAPAPAPTPTPTPTPTPDTAPIARITASKNSVNVGEVVNLSGSGSRDDKGITKYEWDFTSNGSIDAAGVNASTSYNTAGTYRITLKVTDTIGQTGTATLNITVSAIGTAPPPSPAPIPPSRDDDDRKKEGERKKKEDDERKKREDERKKKEDDERKRRR
ncbi:MAG: PKD domain-containing protein [Nitrospirota bacterium]